MNETNGSEESITTLAGGVLRLPTNWAMVELGNFIVKGGGTVDPSRHSEEVFDLYSIPSYDTQEPELLKGSEIGSTKKVIQTNDVLLSRIVPHIQRSWVVGANSGRRQIGSGEWIIFRGNAFVPKYMRYFLLSYSFHRKLMTTLSGVGGSLTRANPNQVAAFDCPLPPIAEQHRIVARIEELFSSLDAGVESLKKAQAQLKTYRQAVLKWAFEGRLTNTNIKGGKLPQGWRWASISEITAKLDQGWSPRCENEKSHNHEEWAVIKTTAIQHNSFRQDENKKLPSNLKPREQHELVANDILITRAGPRIRVGVCCLVKNVRPKLLNCDKAYRIKVNFDMILPEFLAKALNSPQFMDVIENCKSGGSDSGLNLTQNVFLAITVPLPPLSVQSCIVNEIESRLSVCDKLEESIAQSLKQAEALRQSILKKAFEGRLVPQDPNDEPASVLLERIRAEREKAGAAVAKSATTARRKKKA